ncbi:MAG: hypothetical protein AAFX65_12545 [Cyanobacteria bacterium J06638_7]
MCNVTAYIAGEKGQTLPSLEAADLTVATGSYIGESAHDRYMRLGYAAAKERQFNQAVDSFRSALYERPDDPMASIQPALGHFQAALRVKPGDPHAQQAVRNVSTYLQRRYGPCSSSTSQHGGREEFRGLAIGLLLIMTYVFAMACSPHGRSLRWLHQGEAAVVYVEHCQRSGVKRDGQLNASCIALPTVCR